MKKITIIYVLSRTVREPHKRKRIEVKGGKLETRCDFYSDEGQKKIRERIHKENPGWMAAMYRIAE